MFHTASNNTQKLHLLECYDGKLKYCTVLTTKKFLIAFCQKVYYQMQLGSRRRIKALTSVNYAAADSALRQL